MAGELSSRMLTIGERLKSRIARHLNVVRVGFMPDTPASRALEEVLTNVMSTIQASGHDPDELVPCAACLAFQPIVQRAALQFIQQQQQEGGGHPQ